MKTPEKTGAPAPNKLQFRIDVVLSVLFIAAIFFFGFTTAWFNRHGVKVSLTDETKLEAYQPDFESASAWSRLAARVRSLDDFIAGNVYMADELGHFNSSFQYALGKRMITTGAQQMLTLNSGHLYDLQNFVSMESAAQNIIDMQAAAGERPFLFVYEHPTIYSADQMPAGYDVLDYSDEIAEDITSRLDAAGIDMIDSRKVLPESGLPLADYLMYTDQHWSTRAAIIMAQAIANRINEATGSEMDASLLDIDNFETEFYPKLFLGKYGQRIGTANIDPDDITVYWPKYETSIHRYTNYLGDITDITGPFRDSVIRWKYLEKDDGKSYNIKAYFDYGLTENYDLYENPDGAPLKILLLKDSYSAPIGSFLSLLAQDVAAVDLRRSELNLKEWIDQVQPDVVVCAYSMQMLRDDAYEFQ